MDKKLHQGYIVHSQRLDALFRARKEQKIGEGCHFSQPSPLARVVKLSLGSFSLGSMIGALGCLVAVGVRVERFDRRGTEPFEPFEPFEFFQNRNFPEFVFRKFNIFRKFSTFFKLSAKFRQNFIKI